MSCRRAFEVDLASFVVDPTGAAWAHFRDHYPRCSACAAEVRTWTELQAALGRESHPEPEELVRYTDEPAALAPVRRNAIAEHLRACAVCRDETHTLRRFDVRAANARARVPSPLRPRLLPMLGRIVWHPGFAYAVALLVGLYPLLTGRTNVPLREAKPVEAPPAQRTKNLGYPAGDDEPVDRLAKQAEPTPRGRSETMKSARRSAGTPGPTVSPATTPPPAAAAPTEVRPRSDAEAAPEVAQLKREYRAMESDAPSEIVMPPGAEIETTIPGGDEIALRIDPAPFGADLVRVTDESDQRTVSAPGDATIRVSTEWLRPGRYRVELLARGRTIARARVIVSP